MNIQIGALSMSACIAVSVQSFMFKSLCGILSFPISRLYICSMFILYTVHASSPLTTHVQFIPPNNMVLYTYPVQQCSSYT